MSYIRSPFYDTLKTILSAYIPYFKRITALSYPIIIGQVGIVSMGVADMMMIGQLDATNLAAAGVANSVFFLVSILGMGTLSAVSPLVAKSKGAGHINETAQLFRQGIIAALLLSIGISAIIFAITENIGWLRQSEDVALLTKPYLHILNGGIPFLMLFLAAKQFSDGLSLTKPSAIITIIAVLINIVFNWLLIYGHWGFPKLGLNGTGYATGISRIFMCVAMMGYVLLHKLYKPYLHLKEKAGSGYLLKEIFRVGLPSGFQYFFEVGAFASAAIIIGWFGKNELAAHQVAINLASVTYMVATGISAGGSIAVGDAIGRKHKEDLMRAGRAALIMAAVFMGCCSLLFLVFNQLFVGLYTHDPIVTGMAGRLLLIAALFQLSDGIQCVALGTLRGLSDTKVPTLITIVAYWVIGIPSGLLLARSFDLTLYGIWFGLSLGLAFSAVMLTIRFIRESRSINFVQEAQEKYREQITTGDTHH